MDLATEIARSRGMKKGWHFCLKLVKPRPGSRRTCKGCKAAYSKRYRDEGRYESSASYYARIKDTAMNRAKGVVSVAVRMGRLPDVKQLRCSDCGERAACWEHRDYRYALWVEPVCVSCNSKRGPGKNRGF